MKVSADTVPTTMESPEAPDYMNERVFQRNRLQPRAYFLPAQTLSLSGRWKFKFMNSPLDSEPCSDEKSAWAMIDVPGHWQLQGYGIPQYTNFDYPFPCQPPLVPSENPTGLYETTFAVPDEWGGVDGGLDYRLRFEGVDSAFHLWVNGVEIGYNQGSRNASEFDISHVVEYGEGKMNTLKVKVYQWSDGSYIEDQDMWWLSGIYRDVSLLAFPKKGHVEDFFVRTTLDTHYEDATLDVDFTYQAQSAVTLELALRDTEGRMVQPGKSLKLNPESTTKNFKMDVSNPSKWTAEHPYLYELQVSLSCGGQILQNITQQVGFRNVEISKGLLRVNGVPISIRGVNRHDHHPRFGRAVPLDFIKHDLKLMKTHNVNALRCSHYPNDPRLVQIANEIGLYVMDEADLECHGSGVDFEHLPSDNPSWKEAYLDRMQQLVHRDKNSPSVIMWSLGNESFYGQNHQTMYEWSKSFDPTRPVHYEGDHEFRASDICSYMYTGVADLAKLATQDGDEYEKPIFLQEYGHAMGNGPGALKEYQETFCKYRRLQGGFIWEWSNHGLLESLNDGSGRMFYAYGGDFGDQPNDKNFVMDGLCDSEHRPNPGLLELKEAYQPLVISMKDSTIQVENRYDFDSLDDLEVSWNIICYHPDGDKRYLQSGKSSVRHFSSDTGPGCQFPLGTFDQASLTCDISRPQTWIKVSFKHVARVLWADSGHDIARAEFRLDNGPILLPMPVTRSLQSPEIESEPGLLRVTGPTFELNFNTIQGMISKWKYKSVHMLQCSPDLTFYRALTDNDKPGQSGDWKGHRLDAMTHSIRRFSHQMNNDTGILEVMVESWIAPPVLPWGFATTTTYKIHSDGKLLIHVRASPKGPAPGTVARAGLEMTLPEDRIHAQWFGRGPGQSYRDMKDAEKIGVWKRSVDQMMHIYEMPQENGNRTDTRWVKITDERGIGLKAVLQRGSVADNTKSESPDNKDLPKQSSEIPSSPLDNWAMEPPPYEQDANREGFDFCLSRFTTAELDEAEHPHELKTGKYILFRIDDDHHGLGSASCGPDTLEQHQLKMREFEFTVSLEPTGI